MVVIMVVVVLVAVTVAVVHYERVFRISECLDTRGDEL